MAEGSGRRVALLLRDSLAARDEVARMEARVEAFETHLKAFLAVVRRVAAAELASTEQARGLSAELLQFVRAMGASEGSSMDRTSPSQRPHQLGGGGQPQETEVFEPAMQRFGNTLSRITELREQAAQNMEILFAGPLQAFLNTEFRELKELKRVFERASEEYEAAVSRAVSIQNRAEARKEGALTDMRKAKAALNCAAFDYLCKMEGIDAKRNFEFLERMCSYMVAQTACFHGGYDGLSELSPLLRSLTSVLSDVREGFAQSQSHIARDRAQLETLVPSSSLEMVEADASVPLQGYLMKRSSSVRKDWKRRWFFIANREVQYTRSWRDSAVLGRIPLLTAAVKPAPPKPKELDRENCFEVISPTRRFMLQAPSASIMQQWVQLATAAISENLLAGSKELQEASRERDERSLAEALNRPQVVVRPASTSSVGPGGATGAGSGFGEERGVGADGMGVSAGSGGVPEGGQSSVYEVIVSFDAANARCADCGAARPAWVSINIGVVLCIQCAGIHRSLGVRVSKVRSMTLDGIEPEVLEILRQLGNAAVNGMLEYSLSAPLIQPSSPAARKERYIRQKYVEMEFVERRVLSAAQDVRELFEAVASNDILTVASLLVHGLSLATAREEHGHTALHIAVMHNYAAMAEFLFLNDAPLNAVNSTRETALHLAAEENAGEAAAVLMRHTAVRSLRNSEGKTAFEIACERGFAEMAVEVIRDKGQEESLVWVESATPDSRPCKVKIDFGNLKPRRPPPAVPPELPPARSLHAHVAADGLPGGPAAALVRAAAATGAAPPPLPSKAGVRAGGGAAYPSLATNSPPAQANSGAGTVTLEIPVPSGGGGSVAPRLPPRASTPSGGTSPAATSPADPHAHARGLVPPPLPARKASGASPQDATQQRFKPPLPAKTSPLQQAGGASGGGITAAAGSTRPPPALPPKPLPPVPGRRLPSPEPRDGSPGDAAVGVASAADVAHPSSLALVLPTAAAGDGGYRASVGADVPVLPGAALRRADSAGGRGRREGRAGGLAPPPLRFMHQRSKSSDNVFAMLAAMADDVREQDGANAPFAAAAEPPALARPMREPPSPRLGPSSPRAAMGADVSTHGHGRKRSSSVTEAGPPAGLRAAATTGGAPMASSRMLGGPPSRPPPRPGAARPPPTARFS